MLRHFTELKLQVDSNDLGSWDFIKWSFPFITSMNQRKRVLIILLFNLLGFSCCHDLLFKIGIVCCHDLLFKIGIVCCHDLLFKIGIVCCHDLLFKIGIVCCHDLLFKIGIVCCHDLLFKIGIVCCHDLLFKIGIVCCHDLLFKIGIVCCHDLLFKIGIVCCHDLLFKIGIVCCHDLLFKIGIVCCHDLLFKIGIVTIYPNNSSSDLYFLAIPRATMMMMQWGQFLDHDITFTPVVNESLLCCSPELVTGGKLHHDVTSGGPCYPIIIGAGDSYFDTVQDRQEKPQEKSWAFMFARWQKAVRPTLDLDWYPFLTINHIKRIVCAIGIRGLHRLSISIGWNYIMFFNIHASYFNYFVKNGLKHLNVYLFNILELS